MIYTSFEEDLIVISIKNMERCLKRINYLHQVDVGQTDNTEIKGLIEKEIKELVDEYTKTYETLKQYVRSDPEGNNNLSPLNPSDFTIIKEENQNQSIHSGYSINEDRPINSNTQSLQILNRTKNDPKISNSLIQGYINEYTRPKPKPVKEKSSTSAPNDTLSNNQTSIKVREANPLQSKSCALCPKCGKTIPKGNYCIECGYQLDNPTPINSQEKILGQNTPSKNQTEINDAAPQKEISEQAATKRKSTILSRLKGLSTLLIMDTKSPESNLDNLKLETISLMSITFGSTLLLAAVLIAALPLQLLLKVVGNDTVAQLITYVIDLVPGIFLPISVFSIFGWTNLGLFTLVMGTVLVMVGIGIWKRNTAAIRIGTIIFLASAILHVIVLFNGGLINESGSLLGILINAIAVILLYKQ